MKVDVSSTNNKEHISTIYSYGEGFKNVEISNSAHIVGGNLQYGAVGLFQSPEGTETLKVENTGAIEAYILAGGTPVFTEVSKKFTLKNKGKLKLNINSELGFVINGKNETEYFIENIGENALFEITDVSGFSIFKGKAAKIKNTGIIGTNVTIDGIENVYIENAGTINGNIFIYPDNGSFHLKSLKGSKLSSLIDVYTSNNTVELENGTDISDETMITVGSGYISFGNDLVMRNNHLKINQEVRIKNLGDWEPNANRMFNWNKFTLGEQGKIILVDQLGSISSNIIAEQFTNNGILSLDPTKSSGDIKYNQTLNNGIFDLTEGSRDPAQTLTLYGDYVGGENSKLRVDSKWNNPDVQENDQLIIKGKASGTTKVEVKDVIAGDVIRSSVEKNGGWSKPVVIVEQGDEGKVVFTGTANTQGAEEAQLARRENGSATEYTWVLNAQVTPVMPQPATPVVPQPSPVQPSPAIPKPSQAAQSNPVVPQPNSTMPQITAPSIYAKTVAGYVQTNFINREIGLAQLGRLYERVGEQQLQNVGKPAETLNSWGRTRFSEGVLQGKNRFGVSSNQGLVQVGQDVAVKEFDSGYARQGLMFGHSWANNQFYDKFRAENGIITTDKAVGKGKTKAFSLGAYHTYYGNDNSYLDVVANLSWLENKYFSTQTALQSGFGAGVSVEVGRSYSLNPQWRIEPQVQLKAQYLTLGSVNDGVRKVKADDNISVQGRVGMHITNNQLYLSTNLVQDLTPAETTVKIGQSSVTERYNATQFDVALGGNVALSRDKTLALYGEAKYSRALGGSNKVFSHRNGRENYTAQIGVRFQW
ncbi:hypothetical protein A1D25_04305 [Ursidibacter arcticus]|uniref:autotransporter outer membrane beta-barrel domain-containing protein n=1 Tax=Ursidibacter arcticus TaxID=1524965 RepID=UPI0012FC257D|nr:autotransporter outer membrane beta-barrel domain-containing protein [Ursidibacter arcticus]KAE9536020.1 hypothetical protein A1D25_04305 [Ursidibacter arcticus]